MVKALPALFKTLRVNKEHEVSFIPTTKWTGTRS